MITSLHHRSTDQPDISPTSVSAASVTLVFSEDITTTESFITHSAAVGFLPRVDHHVPCQSWKLHKTFPTSRATESSLLLHMGSHVPHKMSPLSKAFFTNWAAESFLFCVKSNVSHERLLPFVPFTTNWATHWVKSCLDPHELLQMFLVVRVCNTFRGAWSFYSFIFHITYRCFIVI